MSGWNWELIDGRRDREVLAYLLHVISNNLGRGWASEARPQFGPPL